MDAADTRTARSGRVLPWVVVFLAAVLPLLPTLDNGYVYDDKVLFGEAWGDVTDALTEDLFGRDETGHSATGYYRPVVRLSYQLDAAIHRTLGLGRRASEAAFHLTNILIHAGICLLLFAALRGAPVLARYAFATAVVYAAHPIHSESICLITGRTDPLAWLLFLLAWSPARKGKVGIALALFTAAQFSKESAAALVPLLAAAPLLGGVARPRRAAVILLGGGLLISAGFLILKIYGLGITPPPGVWTGEGDLAARFLTFVSVLPRYVWMVLWPERLSITHEVTLVTSVSLSLLGGLAIAIAGMALVVFGRGPLRAGALLFFLPLLPASNLVPITYAFQDIPFPLFERYLYIPSAGALLILMVLLDDVLARFSARSLRASSLAAAATLLALPLGARQWDRAEDFRSDYTLLQSAVEKGFGAEEVRLKRAGALYLAGEWERALDAYDRFLARTPGHRTASLERAQLLADMAEIRQEQAAGHMRAGQADIAKRLSQEAARLLKMSTVAVRAVLDVDENDGWALEVLAALTAIGGDLDGAAGLYRRASQSGGTTPNLVRNFVYVADQLRRRADAVRQGGAAKISEALAAYAHVLRVLAGSNPPREIPDAIRPIVLRTLAEFGDTQVLAGQAVQAASTYRWLLSHDATQFRAHEGLGYLAKQAEDRAEAYRQFEAALRIEPDAFYAMTEMQTMLAEDGRRADAADYLRRIQTLFEKHGIRAGDSGSPVRAGPRAPEPSDESDPVRASDPMDPHDPHDLPKGADR